MTDDKGGTFRGDGRVGELNGRYDGEASAVMHYTDAESLLLIVLGGDHGSGATVLAKDKSQMPLFVALLELIAKQLRADIAASEQEKH